MHTLQTQLLIQKDGRISQPSKRNALFPREEPSCLSNRCHQSRMNASRNRPINLRLCARKQHTNVTSLSYFPKSQLAGASNQAPKSLSWPHFKAKDSPARTHPKRRSGNKPTPRFRTHPIKTSPAASTSPSNEATSVGGNGPGGSSGNLAGEAVLSMATMIVHDGPGCTPEPAVFPIFSC